MASCASCGTTILFGGTKVGTLQFCNAKCLEKGNSLAEAAQRIAQVPDSEAINYARRIHAGLCPKCSGNGPIDIHTSYLVWSALIMTKWQTKSQISCRPCGVKSQASNLLLSTLVGWWGFPWGLIMTPVQIIRNILVLVSPPNPSEPSQMLIQESRIQIASNKVFPSAISPA